MLMTWTLNCFGNTVRRNADGGIESTVLLAILAMSSSVASAKVRGKDDALDAAKLDPTLPTSLPSKERARASPVARGRTRKAVTDK